MSGIQIGNSSLPPGYAPPVIGSPGNSGDGINYPYDPKGPTPNFWINWNSVPPPSAAQIEQQYEGLMDYLKENPGGCYNGSLLLLQFTTDIGEHINDPQLKGSNLAQFISNQIYVGGARYYLQDVIQLAAYGCAVGQPSLQAGIDAATAFLKAIQAATQNITGAADIFDKMNIEAINDLGTITEWCTDHWSQIPNAPSGTWMDDESKGADPDINGPQPILNFSQFADDATFYLGSIIQPPNGGSNSSVNSAIDGMYGVSIAQIFEQWKGNPWAILYFLMSQMFTGRDADQGRAVNGYSNVLSTIKQANALVANMTADLNAPTFNSKDFYKNLSELKELVGKNPSLASVYTQLQQDFGQINSQNIASSLPPTQGQNTEYTIGTGGYYNFPPGMIVTINNQQITVQAPGLMYLPAGTVVNFNFNNEPVNMGQLAAMGDFSGIDYAMNGPPPPAPPNPVGWNSTIKSTMTSGLTAATSALNSQSAAINQQISQVTQNMQAIENAMKQFLGAMTSQIQTIVKNVQSLLS